MALYAVGDIHGCIDELRLLLDKVGFEPGVDELWSVGDLVGRGPHSKQVLECVDALGSSFRCVLGNHDLHLLSVLCGVKPANPKDRTELIHQGPERDYWINWLRRQPLMLQNSHHQLAMVHAGIFPEWSIDQAQQLADEVSQVLQQDDFVDYLAAMYHNEPHYWDDALSGHARFRFIVNAFTRMRYCSPPTPDHPLAMDLNVKTAPSQTPDKLKPWFNFWPQLPITLVFGHWAALNGQSQRQDIRALDTGCVWGDRLTFFKLSENRLIQQPAIAK